MVIRMPTKPQENSIRFFNLPPNEQARIIQRWEDKIEYEPNTGCWLWSGRTNYSGYDPEINLFGTNAGGVGSAQTTAADRGFDFGGYPIPRVWSVSARFTY